MRTSTATFGHYYMNHVMDFRDAGSGRNAAWKSFCRSTKRSDSYIYFILFRKVRHLLSALMFGNMSSFTSQRLVKEDWIVSWSRWGKAKVVSEHYLSTNSLGEYVHVDRVQVFCNILGVWYWYLLPQRNESRTFVSGYHSTINHMPKRRHHEHCSVLFAVASFPSHMMTSTVSL